MANRTTKQYYSAIVLCALVGLALSIYAYIQAIESLASIRRIDNLDLVLTNSEQVDALAGDLYYIEKTCKAISYNAMRILTLFGVCFLISIFGLLKSSKIKPQARYTTDE